MKPLTVALWLAWGANCGRVLLAPVLGLTLGEALILVHVCTPAVGVLCWLKWLFRSPKEAGEAGMAPQAVEKAPRPAPAPERPRRKGRTPQVHVQVF